MVKLHVKHGDESQFLFETTTQEPLASLLCAIVKIYNGRLKVDRLFYEMESLAKHGIALPANMQGLTEEQVSELKLEDPYSKMCAPQGGYVYCKDPIGRRNGQAPNDKMNMVIDKTRNEAWAQVSKDLVVANKCLTFEDIQNALDKMRGSVMIVYPMNLPPYDPIRREFENAEDLSGSQSSKEVLDEKNTSMWLSGKELSLSKTLEFYIGKNEKTKVIIKLQRKGQGAPAREPALTADEQKLMMAHFYKKQNEMKKLEEDNDDSYMNADWASRSQLKANFQGLSNIKWKP